MKETWQISTKDKIRERVTVLATYTGGRLSRVDLTVGPDSKDRAAHNLLFFLPLEQRLIHEFAEAYKNRLNVRKVPADTSFEAFWNTYKYKVGEKKKAEKMWKLLPEEDRQAAMLGIQAYQGWTTRTGTALVYPERYISQRRWENEYN